MGISKFRGLAGYGAASERQHTREADGYYEVSPVSVALREPTLCITKGCREDLRFEFRDEPHQYSLGVKQQPLWIKGSPAACGGTSGSFVLDRTPGGGSASTAACGYVAFGGLSSRRPRWELARRG